MAYIRYIVFNNYPEGVRLLRAEKNGGNRDFKTYEELEAAYGAKEIHPVDLKANLGRWLNALMEPVRKHFREDQGAAALLAQVRAICGK